MTTDLPTQNKTASEDFHGASTTAPEWTPLEKAQIQIEARQVSNPRNTQAITAKLNCGK